MISNLVIDDNLDESAAQDFLCPQRHQEAWNCGEAWNYLSPIVQILLPNIFGLLYIYQNEAESTVLGSMV